MGISNSGPSGWTGPYQAEPHSGMGDYHALLVLRGREWARLVWRPRNLALVLSQPGNLRSRLHTARSFTSFRTLLNVTSQERPSLTLCLCPISLYALGPTLFSLLALMNTYCMFISCLSSILGKMPPRGWALFWSLCYHLQHLKQCLEHSLTLC